MPVRLWRFGVGGVLLATGTMINHRCTAGLPGLAGDANVSPVIANPTPSAPLQSQDQQSQPSEMDVFQPAGPPPTQSVPEIFVYGPVEVHPHFDYDWMYGNGLQSAPGAQQGSIIQEFSLGALIDLGRRWAFDYSASFNFYSNKAFQNTLNHSLSLTGGFEYNDWKFGLTHSTQITSQPLIETGGQTDQTSHSTSFTASRMLNSSLSADLSVGQDIALVEGYDNSYDWNTMDWINYHFGPRFLAGIGGGGGYVLVQGASRLEGTNNLNQSYAQLEAQVAWRATDELSFQVYGGLEDRQFSMAGVGDSVSPIFGLSAQYQPTRRTQLSLSAARSVSSSDYYLEAQEMDTTTVSLSLKQQLLRRFELGAGVSYAQMNYGVSLGGSNPAAANRADNVFSYSVNLSHPLFKRGTWSVFYQYSDDQSSVAGYGFQSSQVGMDIKYAF